MSRQIEVCAARLPALERAQFLALVGEAAVLFRRAAELRRRAWGVYRSVVPVEAKCSGRGTKRGEA